MEVKYGLGKTEYGPGVLISLDANEVARAIDVYLYAHNIIVRGARTISIDGELCKPASIYVDPSGFVIDQNSGVKYSGRGPSD